MFESGEAAEGFRAEVAALYRRETRSAQVSVEVVERKEGEEFPLWMARGVQESRKNKLARFEAVPLLGGRWIRPCTSCGKEPAEESSLRDVQGSHQLCGSCLRKRKEIWSFYREVKGSFDRRVPIPPAAKLREKWPDFVLTTLAEKVEARFGAEVRTMLPQDFEDVGRGSRVRNYFAWIYADGNRMGETIRKMAGDFREESAARQAYRAFSRIVDRATREAAVEAVLDEVGAREETSREGEPARYVPAEMIVAGGDDLILAVPAHYGLGVAERFLRLFQERTLALQKEAVKAGDLPRLFAENGLTTSAGVVFSHVSYPASQLVDLAAELMKIAKRKAAGLFREKNVEEGTLDFLVVHEAGTESVKRRRKEEYEGKLPTGRALKRTERPYTADGARELCERVKALKASGIPRGKLKALYAALFRNPVEAQYEALRIRERLEATRALAKSEPLRDLVRDLYLFPFREDAQGNWTTPLSELIEIYDFLIPDEPAVEGKAVHV